MDQPDSEDFTELAANPAYDIELRGRMSYYGLSMPHDEDDFELRSGEEPWQFNSLITGEPMGDEWDCHYPLFALRYADDTPLRESYLPDRGVPRDLYRRRASHGDYDG